MESPEKRRVEASLLGWCQGLWWDWSLDDVISLESSDHWSNATRNQVSSWEENHFVMFPEFLWFLGCILFISCFDGVSYRSDWWSNKVRMFSSINFIMIKSWQLYFFIFFQKIDPYDSATFCLNEVISWARFGDIMQAFWYANVDPPADYLDCLHKVWQMQDIWNEHMEQEYDPSWISCLVKSMIEWLNK